MEWSGAAAEGGSAKGRRPTDDAQPTFTHSINYLVYAFALLGFNLRPGNRKYGLICHALFACNLSIAVTLVRNSIIVAAKEEPPSNMEIFASVLYLLLTATNLITTIVFRKRVEDIAALFGETETILTRLGGEERPLLTMLNRWKMVYVLIPGAVLFGAFCMAVDEWQAHKRGSVTRSDQSEQLYLRYTYVYHLFIHPYALVNFAIRLLIYIPALATTRFLLNHLATYDLKAASPPEVSNVWQFVSIHRDVCRLLRSTDRVFASLNLIYTGKQVMCLLFCIRVALYAGDWIQTSIVVIAIIIASCLFSVASLMSDFNDKWKQSLSRLLQMGIRLEAEGKLTRRKAFALSTKLDLYVTCVQLDEPGWSMGGLIKMRPPITVGICVLILTYTVYLYGK